MSLTQTSKHQPPVYEMLPRAVFCIPIYVIIIQFMPSAKAPPAELFSLFHCACNTFRKALLQYEEYNNGR